uniref:hypothetical protein n=1 Tax=Arcticibacter sp. TaxID=1872630 RepID=UPI00388D5470
MSRVITFSRVFPAYHPKKGQPTYFVERIMEWFYDNQNPQGESVFNIISDCNPTKLVSNFIDTLSPDVRVYKNHTIRAGHRWKVGDKFSPRVWSGKPYQSKMITIAPDIEIKKVWNFEVDENGVISLGGFYVLDCESEEKIATNDGLS